MIDREHLARLDAAADASRALLASLEGQAEELAARRADLEARRIRAATPADGLPGAAPADVATIDAELSAVAGLEHATATKAQAERETLADAQAAADRLRAVEALALGCEAKDKQLAKLAESWQALGAAIAAVISDARAAGSGQALTPFERAGGRARFWQALALQGHNVTPARRAMLSRLEGMARDAVAELGRHRDNMANLPAMEAEDLRAAAAKAQELQTAAAPRKDKAA